MTKKIGTYARRVIKAYPQASLNDALKNDVCKKCKNKVKVIVVEPSTKADKITAIPVFLNNEDDHRVFIGYICWECLEDYKKYLENKNYCVIIGFTGIGCSPDLVYFPKESK